jgi:ABC-type amino acid transport substrate-binding protein
VRSFPFLLLAGFALALMTTLPVSADTGYKIGLQTGSMSEAYAAENLTNAEVMGYDTLYNASEALKQGEVEFILGNHTLLKNYENENLTVVDT